MSKQREEELDRLIDLLNEERGPKEKLDQETAELLAVARAVKSLRESAEPSPGLEQKILQRVRQKRKFQLWRLIPAAALAAGVLLFAVVNPWQIRMGQDPVYAMEQAVSRLNSYYGIMEVYSENTQGEKWLVRQVEIWSEGDKYAIRQNNGSLTVNNGRQKWQVLPQDKQVVLLPVTPDATRDSYDLRDEARQAKKYPYRVAGTETIAGRKTVKLEVTPPGGLPYYLWVDTETDLPIQLQTAMQNGLRSTYTFVKFEPNIKVEGEIFAYQIPEGFQVVEKEQGQLVLTVEEAAAISQLEPLLPEESPLRIFAYRDRIVLDYGHTTVVESKAQGNFVTEPNAALGTAAGGPLEVWWDRLRWRQAGLEIQIEGEKRVELARQIAKELTLPQEQEVLTDQAQVKVQVDLEIAKAEQQQVDAGHTPWQLDPVYVATVFVNLQVTPQGIQGEPEIPERSFQLAANNGKEAVVDVSQGPIKKVYLKRLIRQDETGIWSVVGYDPR